MTEYESWYKQQVDMGYLPDKDGYYHWPPKESYRVILDDELDD